MKLKNKVAIVTGASTGIGRAVAIEFAREGAFVYLIARDKQRLEETMQQIKNFSSKSEIIAADLANLNSIKKLIASIKTKTNKIDIIANIAGVWHGENEVYANKDFEDFDQLTIVDTYMVGAVTPSLLVHGLLPLMKAKSKIINLLGTFESGAKGWLPYFVSKRAIEDLTLGLAQELEEKNIQVNCISPSDTATEAYAKYFPQYMEEAIEPELIAKYAVELCLADNTTTGEVFVIKKGQKIKKGFHA